MRVSAGKNKIEVLKLQPNGDMPSPAVWTELPTPKEGTTELTMVEGEKVEFKVEGGAAEDVIYKQGSASMPFVIRELKDRPIPAIVDDTNGRIDGEFALRVWPEDPTAKGIRMDRVRLTKLSSYNTTDGIDHTFKADALVPKDESNMVKFEVLT